jgi:hypothetical protein
MQMAPKNRRPCGADSIVGGALRLDDFAGLDAAGADADSLAGRVYLRLDRLEINIPAATRDVVRVGHVVAELRLLAANFTYLCHDLYPMFCNVDVALGVAHRGTPHRNLRHPRSSPLAENLRRPKP